ncbi:VapB-type antitoxin [Sulfolobus sp. A20]|uniref:VapB-type antitoxin n=2 Tax=Sulfolobaceae TaxID=118883 RepID=UPI000845E58E|nr:VapB-type antitoxin [Sulfolobus sp. A20]TRM77121.1 VapB-type antitoxin [Sulfolobus sp. A20-N-F8]TRM80427.1 VapB-type antitoxin [Sulfolobus sp. A20-N-F6]TRM81349.1 VapB-type antitoxin [Sulfolobus sp. D5]TRM81732.1 VapB-type antitoxin [Sulfolobus sp. F3]TRM87666.1 VapB-type antitoxin [Sulfolobus sp. C3]TRM93306.1 VapB-type antitoxin [Sulfolobus sp. A20-N-G8]TRM97598.1 VapB-type antitoxin [Sulfolobus sp. B1]TRM98435.1 VapB-type antitoxin [Sulfolobus sp. F1]TRN00689.1 VapB-type antitoxin [S
MIGEKVERKVDEKGRVYIPEYKGKKVYLIDLGNGYFLTDNQELAEAASKKASNFFTEEFIRLVTELDFKEVHEEAEEELSKRFMKDLG